MSIDAERNDGFRENGETLEGKRITYRGLVYPWHCDHMGHMNVMWYAGKFDEASWQLMSSVGITAAYLRQHGHSLAALTQTTRYWKELFPGDPIVVVSEVLEIGKSSVRFAHQMYRQQPTELVASCELVGVYLDGKVRRSCPFPADIRRAMQEAMSTERSAPCAAI